MGMGIGRARAARLVLVLVVCSCEAFDASSSDSPGPGGPAGGADAAAGAPTSKILFRDSSFMEDILGAPNQILVPLPRNLVAEDLLWATVAFNASSDTDYNPQTKWSEVGKTTSTCPNSPGQTHFVYHYIRVASANETGPENFGYA